MVANEVYRGKQGCVLKAPSAVLRRTSSFVSRSVTHTHSHTFETAVWSLTLVMTWTKFTQGMRTLGTITQL